jgi:hypothetical protein
MIKALLHSCINEFIINFLITLLIYIKGFFMNDVPVYMGGVAKVKNDLPQQHTHTFTTRDQNENVMKKDISTFM